MASKIILAHVTDGPYPASSILLAPFLVANIWLRYPIYGPFPEETFLYFFLGFSALIYFYWAISMTTSITKALGIKCFSIKKNKK